MSVVIDGTLGVPPSAHPYLVGQVCFFGQSSAPLGFVKCNGNAVSRGTYSVLFAAIGTTYGVGDGSTTFNVPELRGEFLRCLDDGRSVDTGRTLGSAQAGQNLAHSHNTVRAQDGTTLPGSAGSSSYALASASDSVGGAYAHPLTDSQGGNEARPRNVALLACIYSGV